MAVQLTTSSEIIDQLILLAENEKPGDFVVQRIKREIEKLRTTSPVEYYMTLGMLHSVLGNEKECRQNHDRSLKISNADVLLLNYAHSLRRLGRNGDAVPLMLRAFDVSPTEGVFSETLQAMFYSGDLSGYETVLDKFRRTHPGVRLESISAVCYIDNLKSCLDQASVSLSEFHEGMKIVEKVLLDSTKYRLLEAIKIFSGGFEGVPHISIRILLKDPKVDDIVQVNEAIADAFADQESIEAWDRLVISASEHTEADRLSAA